MGDFPAAHSPKAGNVPSGSGIRVRGGEKYVGLGPTVGRGSGMRKNVHTTVYERIFMKFWVEFVEIYIG